MVKSLLSLQNLKPGKTYLQFDAFFYTMYVTLEGPVSDC